MITVPASAVLIGGTLIAAYSSRVQSVVKESYKFTKSGAQRMVFGVTHLGSEDPRRQQKQNKLEQETLESRRRERGFDFWENVRLEKHREYKIPDMNRKKLTGRRPTRVYDLEDPM